MMNQAARFSNENEYDVVGRLLLIQGRKAGWTGEQLLRDNVSELPPELKETPFDVVSKMMARQMRKKHLAPQLKMKFKLWVRQNAGKLGDVVAAGLGPLTDMVDSDFAEWKPSLDPKELEDIDKQAELYDKLEMDWRDQPPSSMVTRSQDSSTRSGVKRGQFSIQRGGLQPVKRKRNAQGARGVDQEDQAVGGLAPMEALPDFPLQQPPLQPVLPQVQANQESLDMTNCPAVPDNWWIGLPITMEPDYPKSNYSDGTAMKMGGQVWTGFHNICQRQLSSGNWINVDGTSGFNAVADLIISAYNKGYKDLAETAMREGDPLFRLIMNKYQAHRCITEGMDQGKADLLMKHFLKIIPFSTGSVGTMDAMRWVAKLGLGTTLIREWCTENKDHFCVKSMIGVPSEYFRLSAQTHEFSARFTRMCDKPLCNGKVIQEAVIAPSGFFVKHSQPHSHGDPFGPTSLDSQFPLEVTIGGRTFERLSVMAHSFDMIRKDGHANVLLLKKRLGTEKLMMTQDTRPTALSVPNRKFYAGALLVPYGDVSTKKKSIKPKIRQTSEDGLMLKAVFAASQVYKICQT